MLCLWFFYSFVTCILEQLWKWRDNSGDHEDVAEKFFNQSRSKWPKSMKCRWYSKYSSHSSTQLQHHFWRVIIFFDGSKKQLLVSGYWNTALLLLFFCHQITQNFPVSSFFWYLETIVKCNQTANPSKHLFLCLPPEQVNCLIKKFLRFNTSFNWHSKLG